MQTRSIAVPMELLHLLERSRVGTRPADDQVKLVLAIHLFLEGLVSIGKAAELAATPRVEFEWLLVELGIPTVRYDLTDYEQDVRGSAVAERGRPAS